MPSSYTNTSTKLSQDEISTIILTIFTRFFYCNQGAICVSSGTNKEFTAKIEAWFYFHEPKWFGLFGEKIVSRKNETVVNVKLVDGEYTVEISDLIDKNTAEEIKKLLCV